MLVPLTKVRINSELRGIFATTSAEMTYVNPLKDQPLECKIIYPVEKESTITRFEVQIDDRVMQTRIIEKKSARERYSDAVAGGKAAIVAERTASWLDECMTVMLGNLLPGQQAVVRVTVVA